jgi:hypothetical protein
MGNMCGPAQENVPDWQPTYQVSNAERILQDREKKLKLNKIYYDSYEAAIKRYGYTGFLTDTTLLATLPSPAVGALSGGELPDQNAIAHYYYQSEIGF